MSGNAPLLFFSFLCIFAYVYVCVCECMCAAVWRSMFSHFKLTYLNKLKCANVAFVGTRPFLLNEREYASVYNVCAQSHANICGCLNGWMGVALEISKVPGTWRKICHTEEACMCVQANIHVFECVGMPKYNRHTFGVYFVDFQCWFWLVQG